MTGQSDSRQSALCLTQSPTTKAPCNTWQRREEAAVAFPRKILDISVFA